MQPGTKKKTATLQYHQKSHDDEYQDRCYY